MDLWGRKVQLIKFYFFEMGFGRKTQCSVCDIGYIIAEITVWNTILRQV